MTFKPRILFVITEDWTFCSHRLPLALGAIQAGFDVAIATRITDHGNIIRSAGIEIYPWDLSRGSTGIFSEIKALYRLLIIYREARPDLVHQVALKPVLYGSFIAKITGLKGVVNALGGMGSMFIDGGKRRQLLRGVILASFKWLLSGKNKLLILQNPDDRDLMIFKAGANEQSIRLVRGSGVDVELFNISPELNELPLVILPARMLWDKGVGEFVEAAKILKAEGLKARFVLVGKIDECNPTGISLNELTAWIVSGHVEWLGMREDMPDVFKQANVVCLPSYREGLPKALLEAAACGRAIVATDVPGCREIVKDGENGILVPARDPIALAAALKKLILDPDLRLKMGRKGREMVVNEFSEEIIVKDTINIYKELLGIPIT